MSSYKEVLIERNNELSKNTITGMAYKLDAVQKPKANIAKVEAALLIEIEREVIRNSHLTPNFSIKTANETDKEVFLKAYLSWVAAVGNVLSRINTPSYAEKIQMKLLGDMDLKIYNIRYLHEGIAYTTKIGGLIRRARAEYMQNTSGGDANFMIILVRIITVPKLINQICSGKPNFGKVAEFSGDSADLTKFWKKAEEKNMELVLLGREYVEDRTRLILIRYSEENGTFFYDVYSRLKSTTKSTIVKIVLRNTTLYSARDYDDNYKITIDLMMEKTVNFSPELAFSGIIPEDKNQLDFLKMMLVESEFLSNCSNYRYHGTSDKADQIAENYRTHGAKTVIQRFDKRIQAARGRPGLKLIAPEKFTKESLPLLSLRTSSSERAMTVAFLDFIERSSTRLKKDMLDNKVAMLKVVAESLNDEELVEFYSRNKKLKTMTERIKIKMGDDNKPIEEEIVANKIKNIMEYLGMMDEWRSKSLPEMLIYHKYDKNIDAAKNLKMTDKNLESEIDDAVQRVFLNKEGEDPLKGLVDEETLKKLKNLERKKVESIMRENANVLTSVELSDGTTYIIENKYVEMMGEHFIVRHYDDISDIIPKDLAPDDAEFMLTSNKEKGSNWYVLEKEKNSLHAVVNLDERGAIHICIDNNLDTEEKRGVKEFFCDNPQGAEIYIRYLSGEFKLTAKGSFMNTVEPSKLLSCDIRGESFIIRNGKKEEDDYEDSDDDLGLGVFNKD